jgi:uncharacterized protein YkwD
MNLVTLIKDWFLPHEGNDHRPHLIRRHGLFLLASVVFSVNVISIVTAAPKVTATSGVSATEGRVLGYASGIDAGSLLAETNSTREANGLAPLSIDGRLNNSASMKAWDMISKDYWAHDAPDGTSWTYWFGQAGYNYPLIGENLAKDFDTTQAVIDAWLNSPSHRVNLLSPSFTDVGFAVVNGTLQGAQTTLVVAHYGQYVAPTPVPATPAPVAVAPVVPVQTAPEPVAPAAPAATSAPTPEVTPTPAPTATPSPTPTPTASPKVTPTAVPVSSANSQAASTDQTTAKTVSAPRFSTLVAAFSPVRTLGVSKLVTFFVFLLLFLVYAVTHFTVWRKKIKVWESVHYRAFAFIQLSGLAAFVAYLAGSGIGTVG